MSMHELRSVLRERGDDAPAPNPARYAQVEARIRRTRRRRRGAAAAAVLAAVSVMALPLVDLTPGRPRDTTTAAVRPSPDLPGRFTADDGAEYTRLAVTRLEPPGRPKAIVTVPVSGRPLDIAATCDGGEKAQVPPITSIDGKVSIESSFIGPCTKKMTLKPLSVPKGASEVTIKFTISRGEPSACVQGSGKKTCEPVTGPQDQAVWHFAIYEWLPAETPSRPRAPKAFPERVEGEKLLEVRNGTWPQNSEATFKVMGRGRKLGLDQLCTGTLADRMRYTYQVNGRDLGVAGDCAVWTTGSYPMAISEFDAPAGKWITVRLRWEMPGAPTGRPVRWSVGLFEQVKKGDPRP
ncbi:hypothetical protein [Sphaerisporangium corydalis]|uniref:Uncharacterized protein n=1 Tax=Sphaerisporangium corydalis TaxID=1441875 RepID=A0ABV9ERD3_9ACTN|nr:hypothetical protein [Sphaerisporangium corydalis]